MNPEEDKVFFENYDYEFDEMEKHTIKFKKDRRVYRYKKLKCSPSQQIQYAQKIAVKRLNVIQKKINDTYARNRINLRQAEQQAEQQPEIDAVDTLVKDSYFKRIQEKEFIKELYRYYRLTFNQAEQEYKYKNINEKI